MPTKSTINKASKEEVDIAFRNEEIKEKQQKLRMDVEGLILDKISTLEDLLRSAKPGVPAYPGQEVNYEPCITNPEHVDVIIDKIMDLVKKL